jgi:hypothetical protein
MKLAALAAALALTATAAAAQAPAPAAEPAAAATAKPSVKTTPIGEIIKNPKAKAALETALPEIVGYYDQIGGMTLAEVAPMSQGAIDDAKLTAIQAAFDAL